MTQMYYRFHWADSPEFSATNAWSVLWGAERSADGSQTRCEDCEGTGGEARLPDGTWYGTCETCHGDGWQDACEGYSACRDAAELVGYFTASGRSGVVDDTSGTVIVFTGRNVGTGFDGEPLVVPDGVVTTMTWAELVASVA
jgi:hypothetical protein